MRNINWRFLSDTLLDEEIKLVENSLGINFPNDFKEIARKFHGASPREDCIKINGIERVFGGLFAFREKDGYHILNNPGDAGERVKKGYIPFGPDPGGNTFYFAYCEDKLNPPIVFYNHELDEYTKICNTFTEFLEMLY